MKPLLQTTTHGLFCEAGGFYIDPWKPVDRALITHAHSDHARWGCKKYLAAKPGEVVLRARLGNEAVIDFQAYGQAFTINGVKISFHPAGHILGSSQIRLEKNGQVVVVSGDYKRGVEPTCRSFEPIRCHTFVTESTFGLPIFRWPNSETVFEKINHWWRQNQDEGKTSLLLAYALGKAQRLLASVDSQIGPIYTHGAVEKLNKAYRESGVQLPETKCVGDAEPGCDWSQSLVVATPAALGTSWVKRFGDISTAMASGWMQIRGTRRRRSMDRGFILSDHVDWSDLLQTIEDSEAEQIWVTHGYSEIVVRHLTEQGLDAKVVETEFTGETLVEDGHSGAEAIELNSDFVIEATNPNE